MKKPLFTALLSLLLAVSASANVLRVVLDDTIQPMSDESLGRALDMAAQQKADAVLLELRTPGGLETSMRSMIEKIIQSKVPVIVYVAPSGSRAASAGFFILESADIAAMAPGTNTGAAHPVLFGEKMDDVMKMKMQNDAAAFIRSLAQKRGRNVPVAESAVREAKSFTEGEALQQHLIDVVAGDTASLLKWTNGRTVRRFDGKSVTIHTNGAITQYEMSVREQVMSWLMDPRIIFFLIAIGLLAIWAEFNHPGAIVPGVVGTICILLAIFALNLLPVRFAAIGLLIAAFVFFALEAKYTSFGLLGLAGVICMVLGAMLLVDGPIPEMRVDIVTALVVSLPIGIIAVFLMTLVLRARKNRVATGQEGMIGEIGVARTTLGPEGKVFVHGELWNAVAKTEIAEGARVRVREVKGLRLLVEAAD